MRIAQRPKRRFRNRGVYVYVNVDRRVSISEQRHEFRRLPKIRGIVPKSFSYLVRTLVYSITRRNDAAKRALIKLTSCGLYATIVDKIANEIGTLQRELYIAARSKHDRNDFFGSICNR